jgi:CheY-like chemotaxis protein
MPILDGIEATRMIRAFEEKSRGLLHLSQLAAKYGRIPVIAVSASLSEKRVGEYMGAGFDGWILKPIDFKRLDAIIMAITDEHTRKMMMYGSGDWDNGGWFRMQGGVLSL